MKPAEQDDPRSVILDLLCGSCPNRRRVGRVRLHPTRDWVVPAIRLSGEWSIPGVEGQDIVGPGPRQSKHTRFRGWAPGGRVEESTSTWRCKRGHTRPVANRRLLAAFLAAVGGGRDEIILGVDV